MSVITVSQIMKGFHDLKRSISEWVVALDSRQYELQEKVRIMEARLRELERVHDKR